MNAVSTDHRNAEDKPWALVAGGSGGIGSAVCAELAATGWNVALTYRSNLAAAEAAAEVVAAKGGLSKVAALDLCDVESVQALISELDADGGVHGVVYAAGPPIRMDYVSNTHPDRLRDQLNGDSVACYTLLQSSLTALRPRHGSMVAISSPAVVRYPKRDMLSSAPKAVVEAMVRAIAAEEGRFGVRANCVGTGLIEAGMWNDLHAHGDY
ncbi:MAG: SDR family oxidoreductase, partial [Rhodococcus fascians]